MSVLTDRLLRQIIAAALNTADSRAELEALAREFEQGPLPLNVARVLRSVTAAMPSSGHPPTGNDESRSDEEELVEFIQRRKISKNVARLVMVDDIPTLKNKLADAKQTVRSYVRQYFGAGGSLNAFVDKYQRGPGMPDPYLEGIVQRVSRS